MFSCCLIISPAALMALSPWAAQGEESEERASILGTHGEVYGNIEAGVEQPGHLVKHQQEGVEVVLLASGLQLGHGEEQQAGEHRWHETGDEEHRIGHQHLGQANHHLAGRGGRHG